MTLPLWRWMHWVSNSIMLPSLRKTQTWIICTVAIWMTSLTLQYLLCHLYGWVVFDHFSSLVETSFPIKRERLGYSGNHYIWFTNLMTPKSAPGLPFPTHFSLFSCVFEVFKKKLVILRCFLNFILQEREGHRHPKYFWNVPDHRPAKFTLPCRCFLWLPQIHPRPLLTNKREKTR